MAASQHREEHTHEEHDVTACHYKNKKNPFTLKWQLKFVAMIVFTAILFVLKITVGHLSNSMALIADSFHMVTDFVALIIGFIALRIANTTNKQTNHETKRYTFGWVRAEVLGGLMNTVFLMALCFSVSVDCLKRFLIPEKIKEPKPVLIVGCASFFINLVGLFLFRASREQLCAICGCGKKHESEEVETLMLKTVDTPVSTPDEESISITTELPNISWQSEYETPHNLNIRGVYLHILEHFLVSFIIIVSAIINIYVKAKWVAYIDPAFTILVIGLILHSTIPLFRETIILFMQSVPANIKIKDIEERLTSRIPAVVSIHEFHVWQLGGNQVIASAHLLFKREEDFQRHSKTIKSFFRHEGLACITFQPEFLPKDILQQYEDETSSCSSSLGSDICYYKCYKDGTDCMPMQCCLTDTPKKECMGDTPRNGQCDSLNNVGSLNVEEVSANDKIFNVENIK